MAQTADYDLGPHDFPRGWFMLGDAASFGAAPTTLRYFGKDMVFYRGESGAPHLVHAYCPHMGAHIGRNTTSYIVQEGQHVEGESIRCPFHGWRFGPDGRCNEVPYAPGFAPEAARLKTYEVVERAGVIWMWHDPEDGAPDYPLPPFAEWDQQDEGWVRWRPHELGTIAIHPIEVVDNMADFGHMGPIHGSIEAEYFDNIFSGHVLRQLFLTHNRRYQAADTPVTVDTWYTGPGFLQSRMDGEMLSHMLVAHTPIENGLTRLWIAVMLKARDAEQARTDAAAIREYQDSMNHGLVQDLEIWANKEPCLNPMQIRQDGPYRKVRTWYSQFYNTRERARAIQARVEGKVVTFDRTSGALAEA